MSATLQSLLSLKNARHDVVIEGLAEPVTIRPLLAKELMELRARELNANAESKEMVFATGAIFLSAINEDGSPLFESNDQVTSLPVTVFRALSDAIASHLVTATKAVNQEIEKNSGASQN